MSTTDHFLTITYSRNASNASIALNIVVRPTGRTPWLSISRSYIYIKKTVLTNKYKNNNTKLNIGHHQHTLGWDTAHHKSHIRRIKSCVGFSPLKVQNNNTFLDACDDIERDNFGILVSELYTELWLWEIDTSRYDVYIRAVWAWVRAAGRPVSFSKTASATLGMQESPSCKKVDYTIMYSVLGLL